MGAGSIHRAAEYLLGYNHTGPLSYLPFHNIAGEVTRLFDRGGTMLDDDYSTEEQAAQFGPLSPANEQVKLAIRSILQGVGENPDRDGLKNTPLRVARMYDELLQGYHTDPEMLINGALFDVAYDEMVVVKDIEYYSLCEHHMLPFYGVAHVAYIPHGKVLGLSKIPRVVDMFAHRLQVQERMTCEIADFLNDVLHPGGG